MKPGDTAVLTDDQLAQLPPGRYHLISYERLSRRDDGERSSRMSVVTCEALE